MNFIQVGDDEYLNINAVRSVHYGQQQVERRDLTPVGGGLQRVDRSEARESRLQIVAMDGKQYHLQGDHADAIWSQVAPITALW